MKCQAKDCTAEAASAFAINVPAFGCPIKEHTPIQVVLNICLCADCLKKEDPATWLNHPKTHLRRIVEIQAKGKARPDFHRAFVSAVAFDSPEYIALNKPREP